MKKNDDFFQLALLARWYYINLNLVSFTIIADYL